MSRVLKHITIAIVFLYGCSKAPSSTIYYKKTEENFRTNIKSLEEQNNISLRNAISLLIMSKNGEIPFSLVEKISQSIVVYSLKYDFDPLFITSVIYKESGYNPLSTSPKGAAGLMQLMPQYFGDGLKNIYEIDTNIEKGISELSRLRERYGNHVDMLMAYLGGEELLKNYKKNEISEETAIFMSYYANIILLNYQILSSRFRVNINSETALLSMY